ncbi:hypothetical protein [Aquimarina sp. MMG016]|uniref:hypothetical protein n=1 Tax=Aquimarina sp. MMG016 TaxID=2822690 RepID=UPI001B3A6F92|nr:hypothetical protein [Aquimarina sp. MMG016]MBQ4821671.1 hypothetical protein [Aquimarina sp. MMG016]
MKKIKVMIIIIIITQMVDAILHLSSDRIEPLRFTANLVIILSVASSLNFKKKSFNILMWSLFLYVLLNSIWFVAYMMKVIYENTELPELFFFFFFLLLTIIFQFFMIKINLNIKSKIDLENIKSFKIKL